jgi:hypothetical protein
VAICAVLGLLVIAEPAFAKSGCTPIPGRSALDQYCESIPGASGPESPTSGRHHKRSHLPGHTRSSLRHHGSAGAGVLSLVDGAGAAGAPTGAASGHGARHGRAAKDAAADATGDEPSNNPLAALASGVGSGSSAGPAFVWLLLLLAAALAAVAWLRYRRRHRAQ